MWSKYLESMRKEMKRRRLSPRTIESYVFCVDKFLKYLNKDPRRITKKDVSEFLNDLADRNKSGSTLNIYLSAVKFLLLEVLRRNIYLGLRYSRRPKRLPSFLTQEEVVRLFDAIINDKHKLMIELMYSAGLRVSEMLSLRVRDLEFLEDYGWVRHGKGDKDRQFIIANKLKRRLMQFVKAEGLEFDDWLFQGRFGKYHARTVAGILKKAAKKAKLKKHVHPHILRHSFGIHIAGYESMTNIQALLGHTSSSTTEGYIHNAKAKALNVKSPYDNL